MASIIASEPSWVISCHRGDQLPKEFLLVKMMELLVKQFGDCDFTQKLLKGWSECSAEDLQENVLGLSDYI